MQYPTAVPKPVVQGQNQTYPGRPWPSKQVKVTAKAEENPHPSQES